MDMHKIIKRIEDKLDGSDVNLDSELQDLLSLEEEYEETLESKDEDISELEDLLEEKDTGIPEKLRDLGAAYGLSDHQNHLDQILRLLEDEFDINLIVAPAKNK